MTKKGIVVALLLGGLLLVAVAVGGVLLAPRDPEPAPLSLPPPLPTNNDLVGDWLRVEFPDAVHPTNSRQFTADGKMCVLYGDVILQGSYRSIDPTTLETRSEHFNGPKILHWAVHFTEDKLTLTSREHGWVEKYQRVKAGTLTCPCFLEQRAAR